MAKDFPEYTFAVADEEDFATELKDLGLSESGEEVNAKMKVWAELVFSEPLSLALPMPVFSVRLHVVFSRCVRVLISS